MGRHELNRMFDGLPQPQNGSGNCCANFSGMTRGGNER